MKQRIEILKALVSAEILELGQDPVSVGYFDLDREALKSVLDDAATIAREAINNAFIEELNS